MYQRFYDLHELPFELTADPKYLFMTPGHREALSNLEYGLSAAKPLTLLIGEAGTGKTTLLRAALESDRCRTVTCVYVNNPTLTRDEFVYLLATRFNLGSEAAHSKAVLLELLESALQERRARGEVIALVVDEAQRLSSELLEEIRLLGNMETTSQKLLPLVLAGQPELAVRLEHPSLRQLKQRVSLRCELRSFNLQETAAYVARRVQVAGGVPSRLFTQEAIAVVHEYSAGIPRTINVLCDNALMNGFALGRHPVDRAMVDEVGRDFALRLSPQDVDGNRPVPAGDSDAQALQEFSTPPAAPSPQLFESVSRPRRFSLFTRRRASVESGDAS